MSSTLYRLGRWAYLRHGRVALAWLLLVLLAAGSAGLLGKGTDNTFSIPGTESGNALDQLSRTFPQVSGTSAMYVVVAPDGMRVTDPAIKAPIENAVSALGGVPNVAAVADPFGRVSGAVSDDTSAAVITVQIQGQSQNVGDQTRSDLRAQLDTLKSALPAGSDVALGGDLFSRNVPSVSVTEGVGLLVAAIVLLITFGSFVAAGLPILTALLGVGLSVAVVFTSTAFATISSTTPMLALMLGLAVGIDYALFIISRHRDQLRAGMDPAESTARALATAGSAVVFAGLTVMIALIGLFVANIPFLTVMGVAGAGAVGVAVIIALTLTPALLGFLGERLRPRARPGADGAPRAPHGRRFFAGWVRTATRVPLATILVVVAVLGLITLPATRLNLALPDAGSQPQGSEARVTYDLISKHFGPGWNGRLIVTTTIIGSTDPVGLMNDLKSEIEKLPGVAAVPLATPNQTADTGIVQVIPEGGPESTQTADLVREIRSHHDEWQDKYGVDIAVTGITAIAIDISSRLGHALLPFGLFVVGLSFVLLAMVFRSLWVPLKAALGYLLSVGTSFGIIVLVFQDGWGASLIGVDKTGPVISFMPIVLMGVLFGLAMDYEVFLVSRMREEYVHGGDARRAVREGFVHSATVVTAAAAIMFSVFAAFVPEGDVNIKPIALGLAIGVFVDAFVVRMTLVPAVLQLLGDRAWRFPHRLDRMLPHFDVEGEGLAAELSLADWPEPGSADAVAAEGLRLDGPDGPFYADVSTRVPRGGTLVISGGHRSGRTPLLLTMAGRVHADAGRLKVDGLVAPVRAASIRGRVAVARMARATDPVAELGAALDTGAPIVAIDDLDAVADPQYRRAVAHALAEAHGRGTTLLVTCLEPRALEGLIPDPEHVVELLVVSRTLEVSR
ncbi:MMPL family transporter [Isoptericola sp. b441]|uniref:MMPL family transporter n=1 Tax=Actinotalea lenta TaxID=3064654 RepID=A0ABT9D864_9CELL|nr:MULTISPECIES: MMPL family transporter [unclassified Isoptericola]MDO8107075.1 MMPL family transporter [Isoptericola sp. b441]MDO8121211.1 MMPL family transporter [Isoptericola sp. b490]